MRDGDDGDLPAAALAHPGPPRSLAGRQDVAARSLEGRGCGRQRAAAAQGARTPSGRKGALRIVRGQGASVVVIGGGLAGITAALDCADAGAKVVLVEVRPRLGGAAY